MPDGLNRRRIDGRNTVTAELNGLPLHPRPKVQTRLKAAPAAPIQIAAPILVTSLSG
jgi:hypothetical protein